jgi:chromosome segregation ATPase
MNLVGKIITVSILVAAVFFMAVAMAVYATHKNWRDAITTPDVGLQARYEAAQKKNKELTEEAAKLKQQFDAEKTAKMQALAKLEVELEAARAELRELDAKLADLQKSKVAVVAAMNETQTQTAAARKDLAVERTAVAEARKDRDAHFQEVVRLTDELNQAANEKDLLQKRTVELTKDVAKAEQVLQRAAH